MASDTTRARIGEARRFIDSAVAYVGDVCLIWPHATQQNGYGYLTINGERWYAHRYVLVQTQGPPPEPHLEAAHAPGVCHNRACVNPAHLRWASKVENEADKRSDGTACAKLTLAVLDAVLASSESLVKTSRRTGVSATMVAKMRARPDHYRQLLS